MAFILALAMLILALLSPLDAVSDELASAHMIQHMILMMIASPLLILGLPIPVCLLGCPRSWRGEFLFWRRVWSRCLPRHLFWRSLSVWVAAAGVLWLWHWPPLYEAALRHLPFHDLQHVTFFVTACLFWRVVLDPAGRGGLSVGSAAIFLFTASLQASLLGVFMALAPRPWYSAYAGTTDQWNLSQLEDQQLAGLIMWLPACMVYPAVAATLFGFWLERQAEGVKT